mgnify:CR=1 FL=1
MRESRQNYTTTASTNGKLFRSEYTLCFSTKWNRHAVRATRENQRQSSTSKNKVKKNARAALFKAKNLRGRGQFSRGRQRFRGGRRFGQGNRFASNWNWNNWNNRRGQNQNYQNYGYGQFQPPIQQQQGPNQPQAQANLTYINANN